MARLMSMALPSSWCCSRAVMPGGIVVHGSKPMAAARSTGGSSTGCPRKMSCDGPGLPSGCCRWAWLPWVRTNSPWRGHTVCLSHAKTKAGEGQERKKKGRSDEEQLPCEQSHREQSTGRVAAGWRLRMYGQEGRRKAPYGTGTAPQYDISVTKIRFKGVAGITVIGPHRAHPLLLYPPRDPPLLLVL